MGARRWPNSWCAPFLIHHMNNPSQEPSRSWLFAFPPFEATANVRAHRKQASGLMKFHNPFGIDRRIDKILWNTITILRLLERPKPIRIKLELPTITRKGKVMANYELMNDEVVTITIKTTDSSGKVEPYPPGDVFTAVSSNPASLGVSIGADAAGNPALILTPLVQASPSLSVTVSDSAGLIQAIQGVDIVPDVSDTNIILDLASATHTAQPVPTNPGP